MPEATQSRYQRNRIESQAQLKYNQPTAVETTHEGCREESFSHGALSVEEARVQPAGNKV